MKKNNKELLFYFLYYTLDCYAYAVLCIENAYFQGFFIETFRHVTLILKIDHLLASSTLLLIAVCFTDQNL